MALQWIKTNASSFGGQPHNITLMGESAGAASIDFHVQARLPAGRGLHKDDDLFHQVILQSGSAFCPWAAAESNTPRRNAGVGLLQRLCEALDCNSLAELRGIDCRNLVKAAVKINGPTGHNFFLPTPDDSVFFPAVLTAATPPAADSSEEKAAGTVTATAKLACADTTSLLPTLQGINECEGAFLTGAFLASLLGQKRRPTLDVDDMLASVLFLHDKSEANEVRQHYFRNAPISWETADRLTAAISDALFVHPFHRMLQQHTVQYGGRFISGKALSI